MKKSKLIVLVAVIAMIAAFFIFDLGKYFSLDYFKQQQAAITASYQANPVQVGAIFFAVFGRS